DRPRGSQADNERDTRPGQTTNTVHGVLPEAEARRGKSQNIDSRVARQSSLPAIVKTRCLKRKIANNNSGMINTTQARLFTGHPASTMPNVGIRTGPARPWAGTESNFGEENHHAKAQGAKNSASPKVVQRATNTERVPLTLFPLRLCVRLF